MSEVRPESPRLQALQDRQGEDDGLVALTEFWEEVEATGTPLIEPVEDDPGSCLVTFLWQETGLTDNVVVVGVEDADMAVAANRLRETGGGQVAIADGEVMAEVPCPFGGLLSDLPVEEVAARTHALERAAKDLGTTLPSPFAAMSFMSLSVIPELKLTDRGLVDVKRFELVPLEV